MWTELKSLDEAPQEGLKPIKKDALPVKFAEYLWLIQRDDGTPVMIAGLFRPNIVSTTRFVWFVPYTALAPRDWRGLRRLWASLTAPLSILLAEVDPRNAAAIRVVEHLGMTAISPSVYQWKR